MAIYHRLYLNGETHLASHHTRLLCESVRFERLAIHIDFPSSNRRNHIVTLFDYLDF